MCIEIYLHSYLHTLHIIDKHTYSHMCKLTFLKFLSIFSFVFCCISHFLFIYFWFFVLFEDHIVWDAASKLTCVVGNFQFFNANYF